jgi:dipeptidyl aminopeptidase/acylaminoacyl peptidase
MNLLPCVASALALLAAVPVTASAAFAQTAAAAPAPRTYTAAQFFEAISFSLTGPGGLAFSPDGRSILASSDATGVFNAYALPVAGGDPVPLTASTADATRAVSYFPGDDRVLVSADSAGNELSHIFVRERDGTLHDLTPGGEVRAEFVGWSGDRSVFWVTSNARDSQVFDLYAIDPTTYESRLLFRNPGLDIAGVSPDGRWVALLQPLTSANSDLYLADLSTGAEPRLITPHSGNVVHTSFGFTPDSRALILGSDADGEFVQAWRHDLATGRTTRQITGDWDVTAVETSPSGRYRVSALNADGRTDLTLFDTVSNRPLSLTGLPGGDIAAVRFSADESRIVFTLSSDTAPVDVFTAGLETGRVLRLTRAQNPVIDESDLVEATMVRYPGAGGVEVPALLYRPRGASSANPAPAVVWVHGGPDQSRHGYSVTIQHLVNHGYAVLAPNFRGSLGYGKTFFHLDDRAHGEADLGDVLDGGAWLRAQDWIADDRIAVMGRSYGGFLATAALAFHPTAFAAGIDIFGVTNWERTLKSIPPCWSTLRAAIYEEMGDPATDAERHRRISPLFHAASIRRPLLVVQGANDPRVLKIESDELVAAVRANEVPVEYLVFPDEGHGFQRRENLIAAQDAYLAFLDQHVRR